ncbi:hypothetical protein I4U23_022995 [Adineta vaga]|nr:hypothetical protein I4U23_022995 [Adineta vaga]
MKLYLLILVTFSSCLSIQIYPKLTLDEFFNSTSFPSINLSPNGRYVLVHTKTPAWESNKFENSLWLYSTKRSRERKLITNQLSQIITPKWSPDGDIIAFLINQNSSTNSKVEQHLQLYHVIKDESFFIDLGNKIPTALTWSNDESCLYFTSLMTEDNNNNNNNNKTNDENEWKDVIRYRHPKPSDNSSIYRIDIHRRKRRTYVTIIPIKSINFLVSELLFTPCKEKLILLSGAIIVEETDVFELYSLDLHNLYNLTRLTTNEGLELSPQLSVDGKHVFFQMFPLGTKHGPWTQLRLYSVDLTNGQINQWGKDFSGSIRGYTIRSDGGVYYLGQLGTNVHIYMQQSSLKDSTLLDGWNGTYHTISSSLQKRKLSLAFSYSSFEQPEEVYFVNSIENLRSAKVITNDNFLFTQRELPKAEPYQWINPNDNRTIEGILHYPVGNFRGKNLPLLVLIHGGPTDASLNFFQPDWYSWAPMAATEGWLVLEPNYRGSTGYGDQFVNEVIGYSLDRPGKDILTGIDRLIQDGIVDPHRLTIGGFSYGGILTNWLITQTTQFNAALSGAGVVDYASFWGRIDLSEFVKVIIGGLPWEIPHKYLHKSSLYQLDKVCTPTHIVTGANDIRVPIDQSYMLERGLHYLGVPVELLLFPNEGHALIEDPWHGKIKVREELKWLEKYGHSSFIKKTN